MLGSRFPHPVFITPMGSHGLVSERGPRHLARIAPARQASRFKAVILTVDAIGQGSSDEYVRLGRPHPWLPYGNSTTGNANAFKADLSWADLEFAAKMSGLPVIAKGITRPEDAIAAIKAGAAAVQVSNHGGRALDGTPASITVLPEIADAVQGNAPIIMDSGIRRGMDVAKALALGANAVAIGRPVWWALTLGGAGGVAGVIDYFNRELVNTMLHLGTDKIAALGRSHVRAVNNGMEHHANLRSERARGQDGYAARS